MSPVQQDVSLVRQDRPLALAHWQTESEVTQPQAMGKARAAQAHGAAGRRREHMDGNLFTTIHGDMD